MLQRLHLARKATNDEVKNLLPYLSAYTRQASHRGEEVFLNHENWKEFALAHSETPVSKRLEKLLELTARRSRPGFPVKFDGKIDPPWVDAFDVHDLAWMLRNLTAIGYLSRTGNWSYTMAPKGWERIQSGSISGIPGKCFVAMSFDESLKKEVYDDGIRPAVVDDCKMDAIRIDLVPHNDNIVDKIIGAIRTCQFMVADFTGQKGGVYFEAGFAKGLGREVIWTCKQEDFKNVHFDIAQFSHIVWKDSHDLRTRLADRIKATIPGAV